MKIIHTAGVGGQVEAHIRHYHLDEDVGDTKTRTEIMDRLLDIHGIWKVGTMTTDTSDPYEFTIWIGKAFSWRDLDPKIKDLFHQYDPKGSNNTGCLRHCTTDPRRDAPCVCTKGGG